jgi:GAF domain-containing protein
MTQSLTLGLMRPTAAASREIELLHRISQGLGLESSLSELLRLIVSVTADLMGSKLVSVLFLDERYRALSKASARSLSFERHDLPAAPEDRLDESAGFREAARSGEASSVLCAPLVVRGRVIGIINSYSAAPRRYSEQDAKTLSVVATQVAVSVENARLQALVATVRGDLEDRQLIERAKPLQLRRRGRNQEDFFLSIQKKIASRRSYMERRADAIEVLDKLQGR